MKGGGLRGSIKQAGLLWFAGFREACSLHRVFIFCRRSRMLLIRTGQCFLLNGLIFLGSIFILNWLVLPILLWILPDHCQQFGSQHLCDFGEKLKIYSSLRVILIQLFYVLWFYPLYFFSFVLSNIWYNDIAKYGFVVMENNEPGIVEPSQKNKMSNSPSESHMDRPAGLGGVMIGIGEQVYSLLLLSVFFLEVFATGFIPHIGKAINFILLSWMYAYYCFEYKWNLTELGLDKRIDFFESNWAFFAGFGSPCVLAIFFFPSLVSYGVMAILFPLFVLTATGSQEDIVIDSHRKSWKGGGPRKIPIFYAADTLSMRVLQNFDRAPKGQKEEKAL